MKWTTPIKASVGLFSLGVGGAVAAMAPNGDRDRRTRLRLFESTRFAHRGLHNEKEGIPENSLLAFRKAVEYGYGIELDVRLTADRIPVVFHDDTLLRVCGDSRSVEELTYDQLKSLRLFDTDEMIPLFQEVLDVVNGAVPLIIEIKAEYDVIDICKATMAKLYRYPGFYCVESFSPFVLKWFSIHEPNVLRGQLSMDFMASDCMVKKPKPIRFASKYLFGNVLSKPDFIAYDFHCAESLPLKISRKVYEAKTAAWTVRSEEELTYADGYFDIIIFENFLPK